VDLNIDVTVGRLGYAIEHVLNGIAGHRWNALSDRTSESSFRYCSIRPTLSAFIQRSAVNRTQALTESTIRLRSISPTAVAAVAVTVLSAAPTGSGAGSESPQAVIPPTAGSRFPFGLRKSMMCPTDSSAGRHGIGTCSGLYKRSQHRTSVSGELFTPHETGGSRPGPRPGYLLQRRTSSPGLRTSRLDGNRRGTVAVLGQGDACVTLASRTATEPRDVTPGGASRHAAPFVLMGGPVTTPSYPSNKSAPATRERS
jgi:hypothetical protein